MGRNMIASILLRLRDLVSPGLRVVQQRLNAVREAAGRIGAIGAIVGAVSFLGPIQSAAALEGRLRDVAVTAGVSREAIAGTIRDMRTDLNNLALRFRESTSEVLGIAEVLIARGLDPARVRELTEVLTETRAASGAAGADLAQLAVAFERIAKLSGDDVSTATARAFRAGQLGGVELKDLAGQLPTILSQMGGLNSTGLRAVENASAMLQVVRDGFGTTSEAGAGLNQLLSQLFSESTRKNAAELGVNLNRVFSNALRNGVDPVEALLQGLRRAANVRQGAIYDLLPDQNARQAFLALNANMDRFLAIRNELSRTGFSVVSDAARARMEGLNAEMRRFNQLTSELGDRVGNGFGANLAPINAALEWLRDTIEGLDAAYPDLLDGFIAFGGAAVVATAALGAIGFVAPAVAAGFGLITAALGLLLAPLRLAFLGMVALLGPWGAAALAIATAAYLIWQYWDPISEFFSGLWTRLQTLFSAFGEWVDGWTGGAMTAAVAAIRAAWQPIGGFFSGLWGQLETLFSAFSGWVDGWTGGAMTAAVAAVRAAWEPIGGFFSGLWGQLQTLFSAFAGWVDGWTGGAMTAAVAAIRAAWQPIGEFFSGLWGQLQRLFSAFSGWVDGWTGGAMTAAVAAIRAAWEPLAAWFDGLWSRITSSFDAVWSRIRPAIDAIGSVLGRGEGAGANPAMQPAAQAERAGRMGARGAAGGFYADPVLPPAQRVQGEIVVRAAPGTEVQRAATNDRALPLTTAPDRGLMLGRP